MTPTVTPETIRASAEHAGLALGDDRVAALAGLLGAWLPMANALSQRMQAADLQALMPVTVLNHPAADGGEET